MPVRLISAIRPATSRRGAAIAAVSLTAALTLAGCSSSSSTTAAAPADGSLPSAGASGRAGFGADFTKIRECLSAAGITLPTPSGRPTDLPSGIPSARPSGAPAGGFGGGDRAGGLGSILGSAAAKEALKACGITVPTFGNRSGQPSAAPTSAT